MGPINEWWTAGFDGGQNALIGFSTGTALVLLDFHAIIFSSIYYISSCLLDFLLNYNHLIHKESCRGLHLSYCDVEIVSG